MNTLWVKTHWLVKKIFPKYTWEIPNSSNKIFLTFDDGPIPEITEWVLEELKLHNVKATFFCIGDNIVKHPEIFTKIMEGGHSIGNHTFNHLNGWKTDSPQYIQNVKSCEEIILNNIVNGGFKKIFRPPYGKIKRNQANVLRNLGYKIIMWDVLSLDYDATCSKEKCLENVVSNVTQGSIIVFHDSLKAFKNLKYALPKTIQILKEKGYSFEIIS